MKSAIEELTKRIKRRQEARSKLIKDGEELLGRAFQEFFAANPNVLEIRWEQYSPHFNDGDPCTFGVYTPWTRTKDSVAAEEAGDTDGYDDEGGWIEEYNSGSPFKKFWDEIADDELFEEVFGDGYRITASRNGFDVEECNHD